MKILIQRNETKDGCALGSLIIDNEVFCDVMESQRMIPPWVKRGWLDPKLPPEPVGLLRGKYMLIFRKLTTGKEQLVIYKNSLTRARFVSEAVNDHKGNIALGRRVEGTDTLIGGERCLKVFEDMVREYLTRERHYSMHIEII